MERITRQDFQLYLNLKNKIEKRSEYLCHLYIEQYYNIERDDRDVHVNNVEIGRSGRIMIHYSVGNTEESLYLPAEYIWRTDEEVRVLMGLDRERKEANLKDTRDQRRRKSG